MKDARSAQRTPGMWGLGLGWHAHSRTVPAATRNAVPARYGCARTGRFTRTRAEVGHLPARTAPGACTCAVPGCRPVVARARDPRGRAGVGGDVTRDAGPGGLLLKTDDPDLCGDSSGARSATRRQWACQWWGVQVLCGHGYARGDVTDPRRTPGGAPAVVPRRLGADPAVRERACAGPEDLANHVRGHAQR